MLEVYHVGVWDDDDSTRFRYIGGTFGFDRPADHAEHSRRIHLALRHIRKLARIAGRATAVDVREWVCRSHDWLCHHQEDLDELLESETEELAYSDEVTLQLGFELWLNSFWTDAAEGRL